MTEFTRREGSAILRKTLLSMGYPKDMADSAIWSALWLLDRGHNGYMSSGISYLIVYMLLVHGTPYEDLSPKKHAEFRLGGACPFLLAERIIAMDSILLDRKLIAFGAPVYPLLMVPLLVEHFEHKGFDIEIEYCGRTCRATAAGTVIEPVPFDRDASGDDCIDPNFFDLYALGDASGENFMVLKLVAQTQKPKTVRIKKQTHFTLPDPRLQGNGPLRLGDIKH